METQALDSRSLRVKYDVDDLEAVYELMEERFWTDGLPVIPPTEERVRRMLDGTDREPKDIVAVIPPLGAPATVEKVAINAVMAGCRPKYLPVVIAAVEAVAKPDFNLLAHNTSTTSSAPLVVVNGPNRDRLGMNYRDSCFGPGGRANATIGRALRLTMMNVGGAIPQQVTKSVFGYPGRYTMCIAEWEEKNPWEPLSVQMGIARGQDAVTVVSCHTLQDIADVHCKTAEGLMTVIAHSIDPVGQNLMIGNSRTHMGMGEVLIIHCPSYADVVARDGWTLEDQKQFLFENTQPSIDRWPRELREIMEQGDRIIDGRVPMVARPEQFLIAVAGGLGNLHGMAAHGFGGATSAQAQAFDLKESLFS